MQSYKRTKKNTLTLSIFVRVLLITVAVFILFLIIRLAVKNARIPMPYLGEDQTVVQSRRELLDRIAGLEDDLNTNNLSLVEAELLRKENEQLKAEFGRKPLDTGILARVLTAPDRNFYDTIIIDAGDVEGVRKGQIVYAFESVALGTIEDVRNHQSVVQLFSAPGRRTAGTAEGSEISLTLIGRGGGEYEVRMPRDIAFTVGELVSYQSIHTSILAKVERVVTDPRDPFQRLLAKSPVNFNALKFVMVR